MKKLLLTLMVFITLSTQAQDIPPNNTFCKQQILNLGKTYKIYLDSLTNNTKQIDDLKAKINTKTISQIDSIYNYSKKYNDTLNKIFKKYTNYSVVCKDVSVANDSIKKWFPYTEPDAIDTENLKVVEPQLYTYFGKNKVIDNTDFIDMNTVQGRVIEEVLSDTNEESYFGDITIPKEDQELYFINKEHKETDEKYKFKKLEVEIRDGSFADIRVTVSYKGNIHTFENHVGVSFMYFSSIARKQKLFYGQTTVDGKPKKLNGYDKLFIRLSDVMNYSYKMGNHFIPHDLVVELPRNDVNNQKTNATAPASYEIKQKTHLDKIVEFRAYTDILSLAGTSPNGLVNIEANAKFYIFPYPRQLCNWKTQWEFLPSIAPNVTFSKFEESSNEVIIPAANFTNNLDLIEKRFLIMGGKLNLFQIKHKNFPLKANLFGTANYQLTRVNINNLVDNAKAFSYGLGLDFATKRFNNFGFNFNASVSWYDYENSNIAQVLDVTVPVMKGQAEVFYHPTKSPNQAIFVRLSTFNHLKKNNDQAFYQIQFGYKFSIGSRAVAKQQP